MARILRTGSDQNGSPCGSELLGSPASVRWSAGIKRVVAGNMYMRALDLPICLLLFIYLFT